MRLIILIIGLLLIFTRCNKGDDFCQPPQEVSGFTPLEDNYDPANPINVELSYIFNYGQEIHETTTLFTFTVPTIFENPKGDNRPIDTVDKPIYTYIVKDTINLPDSILIEGYAFNDCGKSEIAHAYIHFN